MNYTTKYTQSQEQHRKSYKIETKNAAGYTCGIRIEISAAWLASWKG